MTSPTDYSGHQPTDGVNKDAHADEATEQQIADILKLLAPAEADGNAHTHKYLVVTYMDDTEAQFEIESWNISPRLGVLNIRTDDFGPDLRRLSIFACNIKFFRVEARPCSMSC